MIFDFISGEASTQEGGEKFAKWLAEDADLTQKEKKSVVEKIKDFFTKLLDAVRSVIEGQGTLNTAARAGQKAAQQVPVLDDFFNALDNAIDNRQRMLDGEQRNTTDDKSPTGIRFSKDLDQYPYDMQTVIKEYLAAVDNKILKFIQDFKSGTYEEKVGRLQFGEVSDRQAADIKRLLGIDIQGFKNSINTNALRHIEKRHGVNGEQDHSMKNVNDLARVGYILENYDDVDILRDQNGNPVYSSEFKNKDGSYAPMVGFFKKINGTYYVAESIVDSKWKKAWVTSVYINKNRHGYLSTNMAVTPHQFTPETPLRSPVSANTKVSQNGSGVNTHSMQNEQKNAQNGGSNTQHSLEADNSDIRYSKRVGFDHALTPAEKKKYSRAMQTGEDAGLRVSDNSILVECENESKYQYKYVVYDDMEDGPVIRDVYAIGRLDPNVEDDVASQCHNIARYINDIKELHYDNQQVYESILRSRVKGTSYLLAEYNNRSKRFHVIGRGSVENGRNTLNKSVRERTARQDTRVAGELTESRKSKSIDDTGRTSLLRDEYAQEVLDTLHGVAITLSDEQKAETAYHHDRYGNYLLFLYFASKRTAISTATT